MPDDETPYSIRFVGANPESLDAQGLIQVLSAITRISLKASQVTHGSDSRASFHIAHVNSGSIDIQGFIELIAGLQPSFAHMATMTLGIADVPGRSYSKRRDYPWSRNFELSWMRRAHGRRKLPSAAAGKCATMEGVVSARTLF
jgi:hypothetical protein